MIGKGEERICLNAVHNKPYRCINAEDVIKGNSINESNSDAAGAAAIEKAQKRSGDRNKGKYNLQGQWLKGQYWAVLDCWHKSKNSGIVSSYFREK
jgi:hypothetical protein